MQLRFTLLAALFAFVLPLTAQDTVKVQTFTWDNPSRSQTFQFPDNPNETYQKIWMKYNMRCHDAAVGNGNVGCYEWDYSCNTFLYDPERTDSTIAYHPDIIISGFNGTAFPYSNTPTFTYYSFDQTNTDLSLTNPQITNLTSGIAQQSLNTNQRTSHTQVLFSVSALAAAGLQAGPIQALQLFPVNSATTSFLKVKLKLTTTTDLSTFIPDLAGLTTVYFKNTDWTANTPQPLNFFQSFDWDGTSNILMDLSYTNSSNNSIDFSVVAGDNSGVTAMASASDDYNISCKGSSIVDIPETYFADVSNEITVSLWVFGDPSLLPANTYAFEGVDAAGRRQLNVHLPWSDSNIYFDCGNDGSGYDRINKLATTADIEGKWNHWAFTKNASTGEMKIFLNGQLWHSGTGKSKPMQIKRFVLGANITKATFYPGNIDEFQIWNKALDQSAIQSIMRQPVNASHPNFANLKVYFDMNEGGGTSITNRVDNSTSATISAPYFQITRGENTFKNFSLLPNVPNVSFFQGPSTRTTTTIAILDSLINPHQTVTYYEVDGTDLTIANTESVYAAGGMLIINEAGQQIGTINAAADGIIDIGQLTYYQKSIAKYELLSLVTPYGNGLNLGQAGKTFMFDVTDFAPILKGNKRLSIEMGGENQEELDISFLFVKGTPTREVKNIQHIWPFRRGTIDQILNDTYFEPRDVKTSNDGKHFKLRTAITGHGQNGEFQSRNHFLNVNGGAKEFNFDVWKECADNPIYPQGGTWIFDRAGWCPGAETDVRQNDITSYITPGQSVNLDYGINGGTMAEANYLVNVQMVTYGDYNFINDASIERIARPNSEHVEFERINPACSMPIVQVKNTGGNDITSMQIEYSVVGNGEVKTYNWTGLLKPNEQTTVELPVNNMSFWGNASTDRTFNASIVKTNGLTDGNAANNSAISKFQETGVLMDDEEYVIVTRSNNNANQNSFVLLDAAGNTVLERTNMAAATTFRDNLDLAPGCYTLRLTDTGDDGLSFWFYPNNGSGAFRVVRVINNFDIPVKTFNSDFGKFVQYDFTVVGTVSTDETLPTRVLSVFPNPASDKIQVDLKGFQGEEMDLVLVDAQGKTVQKQHISSIGLAQFSTSFSLENVMNGLYFVQTVSGSKIWTQKVMVLK